MTPKEKIEAAAAELGITMTAVFVPWSQSRNAGEKQPSLNWKVTLHKGGKPILTTDYGAGCGHCPSYKQTFGKRDPEREEAVGLECERGKPSRITADGVYTCTGKPDIQPEFADVLHSLVSDSDVLGHSGFESWAGDLGYSTDSRSAEATYRECLDIALKLRNGLGEDGLKKLQEACQDY